MSSQKVLFPAKVDVRFSPELKCVFLRCVCCGVYVYRYEYSMGLRVGDVVPYTFLKGKCVCMGCYHGKT